MRAMKFHEADASHIQEVTLQPGTVLEQKLDGTRCLAVLTQDGVRFLSANGSDLKHSAVTRHLPLIADDLQTWLDEAVPDGHFDYELVLDGELMWNGTGRYVVFDVPYSRWNGEEQITPDLPFRERRMYLEALGLDSDYVSTIRQARTAEEKLALVTEAVEHGAEGLMVKRTDAPYDEGKRVRHSLKVKFVKTADVVVTARNTDGHTNADLAVYDESGVGGRVRLVPVGTCSMIGKPDVPVGTVIEVAYLYWTGTRLYQPRMKKVRSDKALSDCRLDQLAVYTKAVL